MDGERRAASACASRLRLMAFDVDGVLTDGRLFYGDNGVEIKAFNSLDGHGLKLLQQAQITVALITGRRAVCVEQRASELGIRYLFQGVDDKRETMRILLGELGLTRDAAGYMGDDLPDLPVMVSCGFSATPADGHSLLHPHASLVTERAGGRGAVREVCDFILESQGKLAPLLAAYLPSSAA